MALPCVALCSGFHLGCRAVCRCQADHTKGQSRTRLAPLPTMVRWSGPGLRHRHPVGPLPHFSRVPTSRCAGSHHAQQLHQYGVTRVNCACVCLSRIESDGVTKLIKFCMPVCKFKYLNDVGSDVGRGWTIDLCCLDRCHGAVIRCNSSWVHRPGPYMYLQYAINQTMTARIQLHHDRLCHWLDRVCSGSPSFEADVNGCSFLIPSLALSLALVHTARRRYRCRWQLCLRPRCQRRVVRRTDWDLHSPTRRALHPHRGVDVWWHYLHYHFDIPHGIYSCSTRQVGVDNRPWSNHQSRRRVYDIQCNRCTRQAAPAQRHCGSVLLRICNLRWVSLGQVREREMSARINALSELRGPERVAIRHALS
jgi:hypothetical protein